LEEIRGYTVWKHLYGRSGGDPLQTDGIRAACNQATRGVPTGLTLVPSHFEQLLGHPQALYPAREAHGSPDPQGWLVYQVSHHGGTPIIQRILQHVGMEGQNGLKRLGREQVPHSLPH
jgi:hypothetical protein